MTKTIDGPAFAQMIFCASAALDSNRQQLNDLNVFPVPDGDTGTNMSLTMASAAAVSPHKKTGVCLLYSFVLSPLTSLGAVPHHDLAPSVKEFTYSSNS